MVSLIDRLTDRCFRDSEFGGDLGICKPAPDVHPRRALAEFDARSALVIMRRRAVRFAAIPRI
ncbi:hypothetical protein [Nitrobacter hamburgensis]|uniref:hypothetical protein n=1 Tax=Nitrobacter hamburgensis TaxID=912 RepID=UPI0012EED0E9|nr:hypothetical protein [Nitrobacter hamburgensis]